MVAPRRETQKFRHIQLIWLSARTGVAVIVSSVGAATQTPFEHPEDIELEDLNRLSARLNTAFSGRALRDIGSGEIQRIVTEAGFREDLSRAVERAFTSAVAEELPAVAASGTQNLLDQPEFQDLRKLRAILRIIEEQRTLYELVADVMQSEGPAVKIGHELGSDDITECSIVTVPYHSGEEMVGVLAILGPRRMEYARLIALADRTAQQLNQHLARAEIR